MSASDNLRKEQFFHGTTRKLTEITPATTFVRAEEYHQDYLVKHPDGYDDHYLRDLTF